LSLFVFRGTMLQVMQFALTVLAAFTHDFTMDPVLL
jgi:hypothetical protein